MLGKKFTLFKLFGFQVQLDLSWLILGFLISWSLALGLFPHYYPGFSKTTYWIMGVIGALGLLFSIVFHELWHSLIARKFGLPMRGITLFIFGGVAEMSDFPPSPKTEFFMAVAGPISSIVLGMGLFGIHFLVKSAGWPMPINGVISYLAFLNLILAGFNILPAFPLDGGRVLRAILWGLRDNIRWATKIASKIGEGFGIALIILGVIDLLFGNFVGGIWMALIGLFLRNASHMSFQQLILRKALEGEPVKRFMASNPVTVSPDISIEDLVEDYVYKHHFKMYPVVEDGQLVGCVTLNQVKSIPKEKREEQTVRDLVMECSENNTISPDEDATKALTAMRKNHTSRLMVADKGRLLGMVSLKDMMEFLSLKIDLEHEGKSNLGK
ncbi:MAG: site-2 protease family protein [Candidatus Aminicenantes bacterium]|jgi:Zn-dependent protease/predicted transcriptional regulator